MKIIFAPDSFKDSLPASRISAIMKNKAKEIFTRCELEEIPLADGDKGTIDALLSVLGGRYESMNVRDYMGEETEVIYGVLDSGEVIIETGALLRDDGRTDRSVRQKLLFSSSAGVGEMLIKLLDLGYRRIYVGAGACITNDGGMGCAEALGVKFLSRKGETLQPAGVSLSEVAMIDVSNLDPRLKETEIIVMCAVNNLLVGEQGATYVYGAYNGGGPDELIRLERGMRSYARLVEQTTGICVTDCSGAGASGGLPAALKAFAGARLRSGISTVLHLIRFEEQLDQASLVVVGEGVLDSTSIYGKAVSGIGMMCKAKGIPVVALVGRMGRGADKLYHYGISSVITAVNSIMEEDEMVENAEQLLESAAERMFRMLAVGIQMQSRENFIPDAGIEMNRHISQKGEIHWAVDPDWDE